MADSRLEAAHVPIYIEKRIRRPIPAESNVVAGSTPVVAFGNARSTAVATLGLNPSRREFLDNRGEELIESKRRLATHKSLGSSELSNASDGQVKQVLLDCDSYFQRNPYWNWFQDLEDILRRCGASYKDGSACHLDLVQWATDPTWSKLKPNKLKHQLIDADAGFLRKQLINENIELLLVNGNGVIEQVRRKFGASIEQVDYIDGLWHYPVRFYVGQIFGQVRVISWSLNLQSSHGVTNELKLAVAARVADINSG